MEGADEAAEDIEGFGWGYHGAGCTVVMRDRDEDVVGEFRTTDMRLGCLGEVWENQSERTRKIKREEERCET